jgi:hypothetical protein
MFFFLLNHLLKELLPFRIKAPPCGCPVIIKASCFHTYCHFDGVSGENLVGIMLWSLHKRTILTAILAYSVCLEPMMDRLEMICFNNLILRFLESGTNKFDGSMALRANDMMMHRMVIAMLKSR